MFNINTIEYPAKQNLKIMESLPLIISVRITMLISAISVSKNNNVTMGFGG